MLVLTLVWAPSAAPQVATYNWRVLDASQTPSARVPNYYIAETFAELGALPDLEEKDLGAAKDTGEVYYYDGSSWVSLTAGGSGAPGGANTQVQFNDSGAFGGDAGLTFAKASDDLKVGHYIGVGTTPTVVGDFVEDANAAVVVRVSDPNVGAVAHAAFQALTDTNQVALRSHADARVASQCDGALGGTNDLISVAGEELNICTLGTQNINFTPGNSRKFTITAGGVAQWVDSGTKPTCDSTLAGGTWFDAGTPDTFEVCTKDSGSSYAWRPMQLMDGDKGDITVSSAGSAWNVDAGAIALTTDVTGILPTANGGTGLDTSATADDRVLVNNGSAWQAKALANGTLVYNTSTNTFSAGGSTATIARVTADRSTTSASFSDVTGLTFSIAASTNYSFTCELSYTTAATTTALQLAINGPASPTAMRYTVLTTTTATAVHAASQSAYDTNTNPATGGAATALPVRLTGTLENVNSGTLAIRFRTEVATSTVTVQRGSWCMLF